MENYKQLQWEFDRIMSAVGDEKPMKRKRPRDTLPSPVMTAQQMDAIKKEVEAEETHPWSNHGYKR